MTRILRPPARRVAAGIVERAFSANAVSVTVRIHTAGAVGFRFHVVEVAADGAALHEFRTPQTADALRAFWRRMGGDHGAVMSAALDWAARCAWPDAQAAVRV